MTSLNVARVVGINVNSERILIPVPDDFEKATLKDEKSLRIVLDPIPNSDVSIHATFKSKGNHLVNNKKVIRITSFKLFNKKHVRESDFKYLKNEMIKAKTILSDTLKSSKGRQVLSLLEEKLGIKYENHSFMGEFVDQHNALGMLTSYDIGLKGFSTTRVTTASIMLNLKGRIIAISAIDLSKGQGDIEWVKAKSKAIAAKIIGLNDGSIRVNKLSKSSKELKAYASEILSFDHAKELPDSGIINEGTVKSDKETFKWHLKAANQGDSDAQYNLGEMYEEGTGTLKDDKQAVYWYRKAADQGNTSAQYGLANLGVIYESKKHPKLSDEDEILSQISACKWNSEVAAYRKANAAKAWSAVNLKNCKPEDADIVRKWGANPDHPSWKWGY